MAPDTLLELQEAERQYSRVKQEYHDCLATLRRLGKGDIYYQETKAKLPEWHAVLAGRKSEVNRLRTQWGAERQEESLQAIGGAGSLASALRGAAKRAGQVERVVKMATLYVEDPNDHTFAMLASAVRKARD